MLHGHAKIELKNETTGKVAVIEHDNLITNAIKKLFSSQFGTLRFFYYSENLIDNVKILPLCPNAIGGILLFQNPLDSDPDNIMVDFDNPCIGYASKDVNSTEDKKRGSLNLTESGIIEDGYKFVWDFTTSQANGEISSIALTNYLTGVNFIGDSYGTSSNLFTVASNDTVTLSSDNPNNLTIHNIFQNVVESKVHESKCISVYLNDTSKEILVIKSNILGSKITLTNVANTNICYKVLATLQNTNFVNINSYRAKFQNGEDGYYYGFVAKSTYNNLTDTIHWIRIDSSNYSYTEGTIKLDDYSVNPDLVFDGIIANGYLYIMHKDKDKLIWIDIDNPDNIGSVSLGFTSKYSYNSGYNQMSNPLIRYLNYIIGSDFIFNPTTNKVIKKNNVNNVFNAYVAHNDMYMIRYHIGGNTYGTFTRYLLPFYLATKNNLDNPVIKTSEQSMKITYTITEE